MRFIQCPSISMQKIFFFILFFSFITSSNTNGIQATKEIIIIIWHFTCFGNKFKKEFILYFMNKVYFFCRFTPLFWLFYPGSLLQILNVPSNDTLSSGFFSLSLLAAIRSLIELKVCCMFKWWFLAHVFVALSIFMC